MHKPSLCLGTECYTVGHFRAFFWSVLASSLQLLSIIWCIYPASTIILIIIVAIITNIMILASSASSLSSQSSQQSYNNQYNAAAVVTDITVDGQSHDHMLRFLKHDHIYRNRHVYHSGREHNTHLYSDINTKHSLYSPSKWYIRGDKKNSGTFSLNFHPHHHMPTTTLSTRVSQRLSLPCRFDNVINALAQSDYSVHIRTCYVKQTGTANTILDQRL